MRVVLDTNVLVSATLIRNGNEDRILHAWRRRAFDLVFSPAMLEEVGRVLTYEKLRKHRWLSDDEVVELLEALASQSVMVPGTTAITASRDPEDDKFLAAGLESEAEYVVTGDKDLLALEAYRGLRIITPAAFLKFLREPEAT
jgi:putative PIN family toxin of toxin-antitoxin system